MPLWTLLALPLWTLLASLKMAGERLQQGVTTQTSGPTPRGLRWTSG